MCLSRDSGLLPGSSFPRVVLLSRGGAGGPRLPGPWVFCLQVPPASSGQCHLCPVSHGCEHSSRSVAQNLLLLRLTRRPPTLHEPRFSASLSSPHFLAGSHQLSHHWPASLCLSFPTSMKREQRWHHFRGPFQRRHCEPPSSLI